LRVIDYFNMDVVIQGNVYNMGIFGDEGIAERFENAMTVENRHKDQLY
jgi:hypothetical protein